MWNYWRNGPIHQQFCWFFHYFSLFKYYNPLVNLNIQQQQQQRQTSSSQHLLVLNAQPQLKNTCGIIKTINTSSKNIKRYPTNINIKHYKASTSVLHNFNFIIQWNIIFKSIRHLLIRIILFIFFITISNTIFFC